MIPNRLLVFCAGWLIFSCSTDWVYIKTYDIDRQVWHMDSAVSFDLTTVADRASKVDLYLTLDNDDRFPFNNLYVFVDKHFNNKIIKDTLQYQMTKPNGKWLGTGFGHYKENILILDTNTIKPSKIIITHGMRLTKLPGISRVGLIVDQKTLYD